MDRAAYVRSIVALLRVVAAGVALGAIGCSPAPGALFYRSSDLTQQGSPTADAVNAFGFDAYAAFGHGRQGNAVWSPLSTWLALAMAQDGAEGATAEEFARALHLSADSAAMSERATFLRRLTDSREENLALANRLFADLGLRLHAPFVQATADAYGAEVARVDFRGDAEAARQYINQWVEGETHGHIRDLIPSGGVRTDARLVLTNCLYFRARWGKAFDPSETEPADFETPAGTVSVPTMQRDAVMAYAKLDGAKLLELNYEQRFAMDILLPDDADGLPALEATLSLATFRRFLGELRLYEVEAEIPRFRLRWAGEMSGPLAALGLARAFTKGAEFGKIAADALQLDSVYHQAFVDVDEQGTEAAAATATILRAVSRTRLPEYPSASFIADHPFLFMIRDLQTGAILFMGRVTDPRG